MIKVLFSSRGKNADKFTHWASKTLFSSQMGTTVQKTKLASKLLGVDTNTLINVLKTITTDVSCIYLFSIGSVKDLRKKYNIEKSVPDDNIVAKYGRSKNFIRRVSEHKNKYGNNIELLMFNLIDPAYVTEAESSLNNYFSQIDNGLINGTKDNASLELVIVEKQKLKNIKHQYSLIGSKYVGRVSQQAEIIKDLTNNFEKQLLKKEKQLLKKENELNTQIYEKKLLQKDFELLKNEKKLLQKDCELLEKENKLLQMEIKLLKRK